MKELNEVFTELFWDGPVKIKYNVVVKQYCEGGFYMFNLMAFMKVTLMRRVNNSDYCWQSIIKSAINFNELFSFGNIYRDNLLKGIKSQFWVSYLKAYAEILKLHKLDSKEFVLYNLIFFKHPVNTDSKQAFK